MVENPPFFHQTVIPQMKQVSYLSEIDRKSSKIKALNDLIDVECKLFSDQDELLRLYCRFDSYRRRSFLAVMKIVSLPLFLCRIAISVTNCQRNKVENTDFVSGDGCLSPIHIFRSVT